MQSDDTYYFVLKDNLYQLLSIILSYPAVFCEEKPAGMSLSRKTWQDLQLKPTVSALQGITSRKVHLSKFNHKKF